MEQITRQELAWIINELKTISEQYKEVMNEPKTGIDAAIRAAIAARMSENYDSLSGKLQRAFDGNSKRLEIK